MYFYTFKHQGGWGGARDGKCFALIWLPDHTEISVKCLIITDWDEQIWNWINHLPGKGFNCTESLPALDALPKNWIYRQLTEFQMNFPHLRDARLSTRGQCVFVCVCVYVCVFASAHGFTHTAAHRHVFRTPQWAAAPYMSERTRVYATSNNVSDWWKAQ